VRPEALALLIGDREAQRLALAWDLLAPEERAAENAALSWAAMAGTTLARVEEKLEMLRRAGICTPEGTVQEALGLVRQELAERLKGVLPG
jgi:hypothetical protein